MMGNMTKSGKALLREILVLGARDNLASLQADGSMGAEGWAPMSILCWAICYSEPFADNPYHQDPALLDAIVRLGDHNFRSVDDHGNYADNIVGWDEWRTFAWMETMERVRPALDAKRLADWTGKYIGAANHIMELCVDMDVFDGGIPNHGIWGHTFLHRVGQLYGRKDFLDMATLAFERILQSQTPDGCFREFQSAVCMQGSPVTGYNLVSLLAVNLYFQHSRDPKAIEALEKGWRWWYDFLFPNYTMPPCLDHRQAYLNHVHPSAAPLLPAYFFNKPEGRYIAELKWRPDPAAAAAAPDARGLPSRRCPYSAHLLGFICLQYDLVEDKVEPRLPRWTEYHRMIAEEACVRRRHPWTAVLSGMTNYDLSNVTARLFSLERQDCLSLFHQELGLLIGSAHSLMDDNFSTFVFYENGAARYLHNKGYLKSTPPLDTLLLRYGADIGALSVNTQHPDFAEITLSLHGEKGKWSKRGIGHPLAAMGAKGHLALRLADGNILSLGEKTWRLGDEILRLKVSPGQEMDFGKWKIACAEQPWEFRWPCWTKNPYALLNDSEKLGVVEVWLFNNPSRPTVTFRVTINPSSSPAA